MGPGDPFSINTVKRKAPTPPRAPLRVQVQDIKGPTVTHLCGLLLGAMLATATLVLGISAALFVLLGATLGLILSHVLFLYQTNGIDPLGAWNALLKKRP